MELDVESFRALARSGPWRWATVHLRHRVPLLEEVEAWIRRPDWMLVRREGYGDAVVRSEERLRDWGGTWLDPVYRPDGLVAERPSEPGVAFDDPMWTNYQWVAMLDPVELSHGVELTDLRAGERHGRHTWFARAVPVEGYDPRCSCCPLLWSPISDEIEYGGSSTRKPYSTDYPAAYEIALDVETAIVVEVRAVGGRDGLGFEVDVLEVDPDLAELLSAAG